MIQIKELPALGTLWWFDLFDAPVAKEQELVARITERLTTFEQQYSRFLTTSFVGILNTTGTLAHPSEEFIALLRFGQKLYTQTGGFFNILSAHTQVARGYGAAETVHSLEESTPARPDRDLIITEQCITLHQGAVDLGGFGKGWLIDELASLLRTEFGVEHFVINGGGDIYASTLPDTTPLTIFIEHPTNKTQSIAKIPLTEQGFAGSGTYKRRWRTNETEHHHIIASHTEDIAAHIVADSALRADVFATIACIAPLHTAPTLLHAASVDYLLMHKDTVACSDFFKQHLLVSTEHTSV